jgi:transcriptional regulator with PAS, ATPase and Fis domain
VAPRDASRSLTPALGSAPVVALAGFDEVARSRGFLIAYRNLAMMQDVAGVLREIPRIAMAVCSARGAQLVETDAGGAGKLLSSGGLAFVALENGESSSLQDVCMRACLRSAKDRPDSAVAVAAQHIAAVALPGIDGPRLVLQVERPTGSQFASDEVRDLEMFALFAALALSRARSRAAVQSSAALDAALAGAARDAFLAVDPHGVVLAISSPAMTLLGGMTKDAIGQRLVDLPGLAPLGLALAAQDRAPETVKIATGEVSLRLRKFAGGIVATLTAVKGQQCSAPRPARARYQLADLVGSSPQMVRIRQMVATIANAPLPILITGETGTGKEILAQAVHSASTRAEEPFIGVNVSALPHELLESELFGYEGGAFTGASARGSPGKFELAEGGTLLLDEIGDMPLDMQAKLLRVLQERTVQRLGGGCPRPFDCHVIASTNRDLEDDVAAGRFRLDLLHRLRVVHLRLPRLADRPGDVRLLVEHRLRTLAAASQRASLSVSGHVMDALEAYDWPGNVRELVNVLDCEVSMLPPGKDVLDEVPEAIGGGRARDAAAPDEIVTLEDAERAACIKALEKTLGNVASAARMLGVAKATLYSKMKRYGIGQVPAGRADGLGDAQPGRRFSRE